MQEENLRKMVVACGLENPEDWLEDVENMERSVRGFVGSVEELRRVLGC